MILKSNEELGLAAPSPTYLALHATCAKVAWLSGAAEYIENVLRDIADTTVLSADGTSGDVLEHAILSSLIRQVVV